MGERGVKKLEKLPTLFADGPLVTLVCYIFLPRTTHQKQGQTCVEHLDSGRWSYLDFCKCVKVIPKKRRKCCLTQTKKFLLIIMTKNQ